MSSIRLNARLVTALSRLPSLTQLHPKSFSLDSLPLLASFSNLRDLHLSMKPPANWRNWNGGAGRRQDIGGPIFGEEWIESVAACKQLVRLKICCAQARIDELRRLVSGLPRLRQLLVFQLFINFNDAPTMPSFITEDEASSASSPPITSYPRMVCRARSDGTVHYAVLVRSGIQPARWHSTAQRARQYYSERTATKSTASTSRWKLPQLVRKLTQLASLVDEFPRITFIISRTPHSSEQIAPRMRMEQVQEAYDAEFAALLALE